MTSALKGKLQGGVCLIVIGTEGDQIATLTHVRSLTARLFTRAEQAQNHVQVGNMGLAFRVILDWKENLGTIRRAGP